MRPETIRGKGPTVAVIAVALAAAVAHATPGRPAMQATALLAALACLYLFKGYRGSRWVVAAFLLFEGARQVWIQLAAGGSGPGLALAGRLLLGIACWTAAAVALSKRVAAFLVHQRSLRTEATGQFLVAVWIVLLAALAVLIWMAVMQRVL